MSGEARSDRDFFGHPRGLAYLAFTEMWERFSFYGMQALLVLYMVGQALQPGHIERILGFATFRGVIEGAMGPQSPQALASVIYGLYAGFAMFLPVFGGVIGDRLAGQHRAVMTGALLMAAGHFLMAFEPMFLMALILLILGNGCMKGNIAVQVGALYQAGDRRRADAFQIFYVGFGVASLAAPLVCGTIGEMVGWRYGFATAGLGMLIALGVYMSGRKHLPPDSRKLAAAGVRRARLQPGDGRVIAALICVMAVTASFNVGAAQTGNVYPLWVKSFVDRKLFGWEIPITWFQSMIAVVPVLFPPILLGFWRWQAGRGTEPSMLGKMGIGCVLAALSYLGLAALAWIASAHGRVPWFWLTGFHFLFGLSDLYVWPVGLALFSRAAPVAVRAMFMGLYFVSAFIGGNAVGWLGTYYSRISPVAFWLIHVAIISVGAAIVLVFGPALNRVLAPRRAADAKA